MREAMDHGQPPHLRAIPSGCGAGSAVAGGTGSRLTSAVPGDAALSGGASPPPGDQSRVTAAHLGGDARHQHRPASVCAGDSGGVARLGDGAVLPRNGRTAGLSVAGRRRPGGPPGVDARTPGGPPAGSRGAGTVVPAGRQQQPSGRLGQRRSRGGQDDRGRSVPSPTGRRERGADGSGAMRRAVRRGGTLPPGVGGVGAAQPRARAAGRAGGAAALCADVARATARAAARGGVGAPAVAGAGGDTGPDAARTGRGARRADRRRATAAGAGDVPIVRREAERFVGIPCEAWHRSYVGGGRRWNCA